MAPTLTYCLPHPLPGREDPDDETLVFTCPADTDILNTTEPRQHVVLWTPTYQWCGHDASVVGPFSGEEHHTGWHVDGRCGFHHCELTSISAVTHEGRMKVVQLVGNQWRITLDEVREFSPALVAWEVDDGEAQTFTPDILSPGWGVAPDELLIGIDQ